jgi:hypothetical protein
MASGTLDSNLKSADKDEPSLDEIAQNVASHLDDNANSLSPAQNRRMLMKTDLVVLPCLVLAMTLAFLDKVSKNFETRTIYFPQQAMAELRLGSHQQTG